MAIVSPKIPLSRIDEGRYQLLLDAITDYAIYMLNADGNVASWNTGAKRFKGYEEAEVIGTHFSRFYTEQDRLAGKPAKALAIAAREGRFEGEGWRVRKDGTRFWTHVVIDPILDGDGTVLGYAKVTRDLTERMENQKSLDAAREALFQSQKMEAVGQLTGGIAHDFNNLLTAILGSLDLVRKRISPDARVMPLIENAIVGVKRGASLTQRMLAFARRQELKTQAVDLASLVRGMGELLQRLLGPSIRMESRFPLTLPSALADPNQLEAAILNLAVNARDAMRDGGPLIFSGRKEIVSSSHSTGLLPGRYVCLSVTDSGEGMDRSTLSRAIEPFFTTKGVGKGTGLGLSMVHGMAEQSGGRLVLHSACGKGTTAEIWLPVSSEGPLPEIHERMRANVHRNTLRILAVDDDALVLTNLEAMLDDLGHVVFKASSGEDALSLLPALGTLDLVITDHAMPGMTGYSLLQKIAAAMPGLPGLLVTGFAELPSEMIGAVARLSKPFDQSALIEAIERVVPAG